jgi:sterol desaturase/sphingolipid hydroxylase (fatty acid hydroxylase superfamily)
MPWERIWCYVLVLAFASTALAETFVPFRSSKSSTSGRWISNWMLLIVSNVLAMSAYQFSGFALALAVRTSSHTAFNRVSLPYWAQFAISFAAFDLIGYFSHRLFHAIAFMWRAHQVHHSESDLDLTTSFRFHPLEVLFSQGLSLSTIALLGPPPAAVWVHALAVIVLDFFEHGNFYIPETVDRALRLLIITPAMHRLHHSEVIPEQNTNFGTLFSIWDRLFGTFLGEQPLEQTRFGLAELPNGSELNVARLLALPFQKPRSEPGNSDRITAIPSLPEPRALSEACRSSSRNASELSASR